MLQEIRSPKAAKARENLPGWSMSEIDAYRNKEAYK